MYDKLVNIIPRDGDMIIVKNGHFIMAVSVFYGDIEDIHYDKDEYLEMTGMSFSDFVDLDCIGEDGTTFFYWTDA